MYIVILTAVLLIAPVISAIASAEDAPQPIRPAEVQELKEKPKAADSPPAAGTPESRGNRACERFHKL